ncbi:MAG: hypothetical protein V9G14_04920 [Cypionkella sp.]
MAAPPIMALGCAAITLAGYVATGHGGALRGFASFRLHIASERLSIVVLFNHAASAMHAAWSLMEAALGLHHHPPFAARQRLGWAVA